MKDGKMSNLKGYVIYPEKLVERYGLDALRYYLLREVAFGSDGVFTPEGFVERTNFDLANDLGNLLNRTVAMIKQYFAGKVPTYIANETELEKSIEEKTAETVKEVEEAMENMQFSIALTSIWRLINRTNKYIDETEPWILARDEDRKDRLGNVMAHLVESLRVIAIMLQPFLTKAPEKIFTQLGIETEALKSWDSLLTHGQVQTTIQEGDPIFPRLDAEKEI